MLALAQYGVQSNCIYIDKMSGKDFNRLNYRRLTRRIHEGDTVVIKSIDRLGRNYTELLEQWRYLTKVKRANIIVLDMPILNTAHGRDLTGTLISDIVLQLLSYVAQTERELIRSRQAEGIAAARRRGVRFGRPPIPIPDGFSATVQKRRNGEMTKKEAAKQLHMSYATYIRKENSSNNNK